MTDLSGKVALVTAGSRGLGAEIVRQLAQAGADVAFTYLQDETASAELSQEVIEMGRKSCIFSSQCNQF